MPARYTAAKRRVGDVSISTPNGMHAQAFGDLLSKRAWWAVVDDLTLGWAEAPPDAVAERLHAIAWRRPPLATGGRPRPCNATGAIRSRHLVVRKTVGACDGVYAATASAAEADQACAVGDDVGWLGVPVLVERAPVAERILITFSGCAVIVEAGRGAGSLGGGLAGGGGGIILARPAGACTPNGPFGPANCAPVDSPPAA